MSTSVKVAVVQTSATLDVESNWSQFLPLVEQAAGQGAQLIALPELCWCLGPLDQVVKRAEPVPGPVSEKASQLARRLGVWLLAGSLPEQGPQGVWNTALLFSDQGELVAKYRKRYLFRVDLEGQVRIDEGRFFRPGEKIVVCATPWGRLGLATCFDLRFGEHFAQLVAQGAELIAVPSAFTARTGKDHWELLVRARAVDTQCLLLAPNQCGTHAPGMNTWGHSLVVDPWGQVLGRLGESPGVLVVEFERERISQVRAQLPVARIIQAAQPLSASSVATGNTPPE